MPHPTFLTRMVCGIGLVLPFAAAAAFDETVCGNGYECASAGVGGPNALFADSPCLPAIPLLPPDPLGTFASRDGGGGPGLRGGLLAQAASLSKDGWACLHPIGTGSPNGGIICSIDDITPAGPPTIEYFNTTHSLVASISQHWDIHIHVLDSQGNCTVPQTMASPFGVSEGYRLQCPAGFDHGTTSNQDSFFCFRPRYECTSEHENKEKACPLTRGDPIRLGNNEKIETETDFIGAGGFPLRIVRSFDHEATTPTLGESYDAIQPMGAGWRTMYHRHVSVFTAPLASYVTLRRETGESRTFNLDPATNSITPMPFEKGYLERLTDGAGVLTGWRYTTAAEETELYDAGGNLLSITAASGLIQSVSYDGQGRIANVSDEFGRQLVFHYGTNGYVDTITVPGGLVYGYTYTDSGALQSVTYPDASVRQYLYEIPTMPWAFTGVIDERGIRVSTTGYQTSVSGAATSVELAGGVYKYTIGSGVTDPLGAVRQYNFTSSSTAKANLLASFTDPRIGGGYTQQSYEYDANGNVTKYTDNIGNVTTYTFDLARNLETQRVEGFATTAARTISTQWHPTRRLPKMVAEPLRITSYSYNGETGITCAPAGASTALLCTKTVQATTDATGAAAFSATADGAPRTWAYSYDANGQLLGVDGPRTDVSDVTTFTYDAAGNLASMTNALGQVTQYTDYDAAGRLLRSIDPAGIETLLDYNARGWLLHRKLGTAASGYETTSYDYDNAGSLTKVTLPDGSYVQYTYDDAHRLTDVRDGLGNHIQYTLDNMGNRIEEQAFDVQGNLVRSHSRVYDILNRLAQDIGGTDPASEVTMNGYDADGNLLSITDPLSRVTTNIYDGRNRLTQVADPFNGSAKPTKYEYNGRDQITKVTDPKNLATSYTVNGFDERLSESSPDTGTTTFTYDQASNVKTKQDARGIVATYTYDALNRLAHIAYPDENIAYEYDCAGNAGRLCSITDGAATTAYTYDAHGHVAGKTQTTGGVAETITYGYNAAGQLTTITLPSGHVVRYGYSNNRPVSVSVDGQTVLSGVFYEPFGPNGGWVWGNSTQASPNTHTRIFDKDFRATRITSDLPEQGAQPYFDRELTWDAASRITSITNHGNTALSGSYGYDALDRLASVTMSSVTSTYVYDEVGNRVSTTLPAGVSTYSYAPGSHRLTAIAGAQNRSFTFDAAGNVTSDGATTRVYGGNGRAKQVSSGSSVTGYGINALGQRVEKLDASGIPTFFVYDEGGHLVGEYGADGKAVQETIWLGDLPVAIVK